MPYNAQSAATPASNMYDWQNAPFPQSSVADPYAGSPYTGRDTYAPPEVNPADYWNEQTSGYDQLPEYGEGGNEPYNTAAQYQPSYIDPSQTDWANVNTYAPWSNPQGPGGVQSAGQGELMNDPSFWTGGGHQGGQVNNLNPLSSTLANTAMFGLPASGLMDMFGTNIWGSKKKRQHLNYKQPSYQGYMFTPEEGFPDYYNPSQEGQTANQTQQDIYSQNPTQATSYDYDYSGGGQQGQQTPAGLSYGGQGQQSYVGQQDQNYGSLYNQPNSLYDTFKAGGGF